MKIAHKLFLILLLSTAGTLTAMTILTQWSIGRGFLHYVNQVETERLNRLVERLHTEYKNRGSWSWLHDNHRAWLQILRPDQKQGQPSDNRYGFRHPPPLRDEPREFRRRLPPDESGDFRRLPLPPPDESGDFRRPPPPQDAPRNFRRSPPDPLSIGHRLSLLDAKQQRVMGRITFNKEATRRPIIVDGQTVGWLTLEPLKQLTEDRDLNFLHQQFQTFLLIAASLLLGAALLAIVLARQFSRPLRHLSGTMSCLASGDYQTRIDVKGKDEIAELARDVNTLAHTLSENLRARQHWIADISHELRTPLTVVRGELEALEDGLRPFDRSALASLQGEVQRLNTLVNDLYELSLSDLGALSYRKRPLDLGELLGEAVDTFTIRAKQHGLKLHFALSDSLDLTVSGDRERLLQLFTNLLENSMRYTDTGGRIEITAVVTDHQVTVTIDDSLPGVSAEDCPRLFERLYRVESSRNRVRGGSGLGLAICRNIAIAHEGTITASPSTLGGLQISITLPQRQV